MKIEKAIEILTDSLKGTWPTPNSDFNDAIKLGIEALKRVQYLRTPGGVITDVRLPGEVSETRRWPPGETNEEKEPAR